MQDSLFRVWGKLFIQQDTGTLCLGTFEPMPDFQYLASRFREYETYYKEIERNFFDITELNNWMVRLRPRIISSDGCETELLSACVTGFENPNDLKFYGFKLEADDISLEQLF